MFESLNNFLLLEFDNKKNVNNSSWYRYTRKCVMRKCNKI